MPTGYTCKVQSGEVTEFRDFALICARAFGACIDMRDEPADKPIPESFEASSYYKKSLAEAELDLARIEGMTINQMAVACIAHNKEELESWERRESERAAQESRYRAMLEKARAWVPPTPDHEEMKNFMVTQLEESIDWDCKAYGSKPEPLKRDVWYALTLQRARQHLENRKSEMAKEIERTNGRNAWLYALRKSLSQ